MKSKFTGKCICGHKWDDHHHSVILNPNALKEIKQSFRNVDGCFGDECEATQFEGFYYKDVKPCHCSIYWDKGWSKKK